MWRRARQTLGQAREALLELGRELVQPAGLALVLVTLVLITREALGHSSLLGPLWRWLAGLWPLFGQRLIQHQLIAVTLQLVVPALAIWLVHRRRLRDFGLGRGDLRFWLPITLLIFAVQLPVVGLYLARDPVYVRRYPSLGAARAGGGVFWIWESSRLLYMLSWEFLFRGYLLFALQPRMGHLACAVQMIPFALMHVVSNKPISEVYFTVGSGLLSGLFALIAHSAWPVILLHGVGAVLLDVFIVYR
jgi:membrane protease YdiL (CAAX protease family)